MDASPERFYYFALPRLPQPDASNVPRLRFSRMPHLSLSAIIGLAGGGWHSGRTAVGAWCSLHSFDLAMWAFGLVIAAAAGLSVAQL